MNFVSDVKRIPPELLAPPSNWNGTCAGSSIYSSVLQDRVVKSLKDALQSSSNPLGKGFDIALETSSFDGVFPVDACITFNNQIVAILEVDGPHHYRFDGTLRRKDKLKEAMYMKRHPDSRFHRVKWDQVTRVGSEAIGVELADLVIGSASEMNPVSVVFRNWQTSIANLFSFKSYKSHG